MKPAEHFARLKKKYQSLKAELEYGEEQNAGSHSKLVLCRSQIIRTIHLLEILQ